MYTRTHTHAQQRYKHSNKCTQLNSNTATKRNKMATQTHFLVIETKELRDGKYTKERIGSCKAGILSPQSSERNSHDISEITVPSP